jgi:hypothetical protein
MKNFFLLIAVIAGTGVSAHGHHGEEEQPNVELSFKLTDHGKKTGNYYLLVYCDTNAADTLFVKKGRVTYLDLDYNHNYTLRYVKEGYRDRILIVNTHIKTGVTLRDHEFDYEIGLVKNTEAPNTLGDLPVAVIRYDVNRNKFDYSRKYHRQVRKKTYGRAKL